MKVSRTHLNIKDIRAFLLVMAGTASLFTTLSFGHASYRFAFIVVLILTSAEFTFRFFTTGVLLPYILMLASPLTLFRYYSIPDFQIRLLILILLIYIFSIPLNKKKFTRDPFRHIHKPIHIWLIPFLLFLTLSLWLDHKGVQLSGDEPHYLMVTQSIVEDGDILLKNNVENKTYLDFFPFEIPAHMIIRNGKHLSFHMPGLSFLLIPFYFIFNLTGNFINPSLFFRISISFINAFFPFVLFYLMKFFFPGKKVKGIWLLSVLSLPLLFHSVHIFPELPASVLLAGSFLLIYRGNSKPFSAGLLFSLTIWFHVKYYPPLFIFTLFVVWKLISEKRKKELVKFLAFPVISSVLLLLFSKIFYGTFNPAAIFPAENYWTTPLLLKVKVFFAYFLDQRDGLFLYAPILFYSILGLTFKTTKWKIVMVLITVYTLFHSVTTVRGAHAPAGRPLVFVLWILLLFTFKYYFESDRKYMFRVVTGFNFFALFWILQNPQFIYQPVFSTTTERSSSILSFLGSSSVDISGFFPSFLTRSENIYIPNIVWIGMIFISILIFYSGSIKKITLSSKFPVFLSVILFILTSLFLSFYPHLHISEKDHFKKGGISLFNSSANFVWLDSMKKFRIKTNGEYNIFFKERQWKKILTLKFESLGNSTLTVRNGRDTIFRSKKGGINSLEIDLSVLNRFRFRSKELIPIWIRSGSAKHNEFFYLKISAK